MPKCEFHLAAMPMSPGARIICVGLNPCPEFQHQGQDLCSQPWQGRLVLGHLQERCQESEGQYAHGCSQGLWVCPFHTHHTPASLGPQARISQNCHAVSFLLLTLPAEEGEFPLPRLTGTLSLDEAGLDSFFGWVLRPLRTCCVRVPLPNVLRTTPRFPGHEPHKILSIK